jgi:hypothetical protein
MRHIGAIAMLTGFLFGSPPKTVPDLSKVDRTIFKEPSKPLQIVPGCGAVETSRALGGPVG